MPYVAMNNFQIMAEQTEKFEERWSESRLYVQDAPGFETFQLLRGQESNGLVRYVSCSIWTSKEALEAWTRSESFVKAHRQGPAPKTMMPERPHLECFEMVALDN